MQQPRSFEQDTAARAGWGIRVMLAGPEGGDGALMRRLAGLGGQVECRADLSEALSRVVAEPGRFGLLVVDCDAFGGMARVRQACRAGGGAAAQVPVILISRDCRDQTFPAEHDAPVELRAPVSAVALRVGFEHALRDALVLTA